jgi:hypothetical protein
MNIVNPMNSNNSSAAPRRTAMTARAVSLHIIPGVIEITAHARRLCLKWSQFSSRVLVTETVSRRHRDGQWPGGVAVMVNLE